VAVHGSLLRSGVVLAILSLSAAAAVSSDLAATRPNIVWIIAEDLSPDLGAYGDPYARTPSLDVLAREGVRFTRAFTHAPVCATSRSGLITGMYPTTIGTHHMRSHLFKPPLLFTEYLRKAGYFVAWPGKTDFNVQVPPGAFDSTAPWLDKLPRQPFFAYVNLSMSHESQIRTPAERFMEVTRSLKPEDRHDPARAPVPPFYPDTPVVRRDIARYYDLVTAVDYAVKNVLDALDRWGVADNTVVFFFGDHGRGLSRYKRWVYDTGLRVPLLVRWPGQIERGSTREDLVSFVDLAPTVLSIAEVPVPSQMQGQPFLGSARAKPREHIFAHRDRMDETFDRIRAVRDVRYKYIRNFHPELPYAQIISYAEEMPTMKEWRRLHAEGTLRGPQKLFFAPGKPTEELYDTDRDPFEINNLAEKPEHGERLRQMRAVLDRWIAETRDLGAVPETELVTRGLVKDVSEDYKERGLDRMYPPGVRPASRK
jgi:uncharacterized sulfatase